MQNNSKFFKRIENCAKSFKLYKIIQINAKLCPKMNNYVK